MWLNKWLKDTLKKNFSNWEKITSERYIASKFAFIISSFLFFLNFYLVWANFNLDFFGKTLWILYIILLISIIFFVYFYLKKVFFWKLSKTISILLLIFLFLIFWFLAFPILFDWWINWLIKIAESLI